MFRHPVVRAHLWTGRLGFALLGAVSVINQTLLVREALFAFHGGEIALGLFFALWLAGIGGGAALGARGCGGSDGETTARSWFVLGLALLPILGIGQVGVFRFHREVLLVPAGGYLPAGSYAGLLLAGVVPAGLLTGALFPLGLRAWGSSSAGAYGFEALGSLAGGACAALFALPHWTALEILAAFGPILVLACLVRTAVGGGDRRGVGALLIGAGLSVYLLSGAAERTDAAWVAARWRNLCTGATEIRSLNTPYQHITLADAEGELSLYLNGLYSGAVHDPFVDSLAAAVVATQHGGPRRVVVISPAPIGPAAVLAHARGVALRHVAPDARLQTVLDAVQEPTPTICLTADPREYIRRAQAGLDMIVVLQGGPRTGAGNRTYTREFFGDCRRRLAPGGVLALDLAGSANVASPEAAVMRAAIFAALREVFPDVRAAPGETHYFFAARAPSPLTWNADSLAERRARLWPGGAAWPPELFAGHLPSERIAGLQAALERRLVAGAAPNRDGHPLVYYEQLRRWDRLSGSGLGDLLTLWRRAPWAGGGLLLGLLVLAGLGFRRRWGQPVISLAGTGMTGMGVSLVLLLLFQTSRGTLYLKVALLTAFFMAGLAAGAWIGRRWRGPGRVATAVARSDALWVLYLLALLPVIPGLPHLSGAACEALLLGLTLVAGGMTALPFAWVAADLTGKTGSQAAAGGVADAADHLGAVGGALLTGTFLAPLLGYAGTLLFLAGLKTAHAASAFWAGRRGPSR